MNDLVEGYNCYASVDTISFHKSQTSLIKLKQSLLFQKEKGEIVTVDRLQVLCSNFWPPAYIKTTQRSFSNELVKKLYKIP